MACIVPLGAVHVYMHVRMHVHVHVTVHVEFMS